MGVKLKRIELLGFKSFAKKSRLDFDVPVVGIVGPNGSGKSNVVEAFRFVLGEQSMKSLRGKSGSDLIFKGSKDLPKGSRASVEITFDNKDSLIRILMESREKEMDDHKFRFELAHYKRTNYTRSGLGMPGFVMGFPNALSLIVPMVIRLKNVAKLSHEKDERLLKNATPAFVVISTATHDAPAWLESGRIYQRHDAF
jgi:recombinational DNA repair ATPase RecF